MITSKFLVLLAIINISICKIMKCQDSETELFNRAIGIAVNDFALSGKLSKKDSIFTILCEQFDTEKICVSILRTSDNKVYQHPENKIGSNLMSFPTKFMEVNNKLFYWYDSTSCITQEILDILYAYNHIEQTEYSRMAYIPPFNLDERLKGTIYYFCKCDFSINKSIVSNKAPGGHKPPRLRCKCSDNDE